ncbi:McrB family protein [Lacinutrix sp. MEBiC02404]
MSFKILKISHGTGFFNYDDHLLMINKNLASVHPNTAAKGTSSQSQFDNFITAKKGDLIFICRSNESVDLIGMFKDERPLYSLIQNHYDQEWVDREFVILFNAKQNKNHHKGREKWWLPGDNSTCNEVKSNEFNILEEYILLPVFGKKIEELKTRRSDELLKLEMKIDDITNLQVKFDELYNDDLKIFEVVNGLSQIEKLKVFYDYGSKGNVDSQPVVLLRKIIIKHLVENKEPLTKQKVDELKVEVGSKFEKNVFHAWSSYFRVLYPFYYEKYKTNVVKFVEDFIEKIRKDLKIKDFTKKNIVHFDGAQNQGFNRIWFAIYNSSHKNQKSAKQLFFSIENNSFRYGLLSLKNPKLNQLSGSKNFDYNEILNIYRTFIEEIKNDDITKFKEMNDLKELLEYKKQIILQGAPGTGKTYTSKNLAEYMVFDSISNDKRVQAKLIADSKQIDLIQFHPAYTYEDFIRGIVTEPIEDKINYVSKDKLFLEMVNKANNDSENPYILIIDEINRANLSSVLGELIYGLEYRNEPFKSMYATKEGIYEITIPNNLYIIGTMNTADRSVEHIDYALRRRFAFYDVLPQNFDIENFQSEEFKKVSQLFVKEIKETTDELEASEHLSLEFQDRPQDIWLGHSYFFRKENVDFSLQIKYEIVPILQEYVKDGILNNTEDVKKIIQDLLKYQDANT